MEKRRPRAGRSPRHLSRGVGGVAEREPSSRYGKIPVPVAEVCKLTWFCQLGNIHANTKGYTMEGKLIVQTH
jgi:hypothetical protein